MQRASMALVALYSYEDMGILSLRTVLKKTGHDVDAIFFKEFRSNRQNHPSHKEVDLLVNLLKERKKNIIGLSLKSPYFPVAKALIASIRKNIPGSFILIGGPHATLCPEECIPFADAICIGEGEGAILDLAESVAKGLPIDTIQNLWVRKDDMVIKNNIRPLITELDNLPTPDLSKENIYYIDDDAVKSNLRFTLYTTLTARGCPFSCSFCSTAAMRKLYEGKGRYVRQRSAENVMDELMKRNLPEVNIVQFNDDVFGLNQKWVERFCQLYTREIGIPFQIVIHPQYVTEDLMKTLTATKLFRNAQIGIQSGSDRVANEVYNRATKKSVILDAARRFHKYKVKASYHIILDNPFAREEDNIETVEFMLKFPKPFHLSLYSLIYFPKTKLTEEALKKGFIKEDDIEGKSEKCLSQIYISPEYKRDPLESFYINLLYLTQVMFMPRILVKLFLHFGFLKKHPKILEKFNYGVDTADRFLFGVIPLAGRGIRHLFHGRLNLAKLRSGMRSYKMVVGDKHNF